MDPEVDRANVVLKRHVHILRRTGLIICIPLFVIFFIFLLMSQTFNSAINLSLAVIVFLLAFQLVFSAIQRYWESRLSRIAQIKDGNSFSRWIVDELKKWKGIRQFLHCLEIYLLSMGVCVGFIVIPLSSPAALPYWIVVMELGIFFLCFTFYCSRIRAYEFDVGRAGNSTEEQLAIESDCAGIYLRMMGTFLAFFINLTLFVPFSMKVENALEFTNPYLTITWWVAICTNALLIFGTFHWKPRLSFVPKLIHNGNESVEQIQSDIAGLVKGS